VEERRLPEERREGDKDIKGRDEGKHEKRGNYYVISSHFSG